MEAIIKGVPDGQMNVIRREHEKEAVREPVGQLLLSANELGTILGVTVLTIRRWNKDGVVPMALSIGGTIRWRRDEITAWINAGSPPHEIWKNMPS